MKTVGIQRFHFQLVLVESWFLIFGASICRYSFSRGEKYTDEELLTHKEWGHSSFNQAIEVAERTRAKQLIIKHRYSDHDDEFLRKIKKQCQAQFKYCALARKGMSIEL